MKFINKAERYMEVKNLLEQYSNQKSEFGQKKSVELFETIFNNDIISINKLEQRIFLDFLTNESNLLQRANVKPQTIRDHFASWRKNKFGRDWVYPINFYVEHALDLRKCSKMNFMGFIVFLKSYLDLNLNIP